MDEQLVCPDFDTSKPASYLMYYDINNMYGKRMVKYWEEDLSLDVFQVHDNSPEGYMLEVDLDYPQELHDYHKDLPFCPRKETPDGSRGTEKLMATLYKKTLCHLLLRFETGVTTRHKTD